MRLPTKPSQTPTTAGTFAILRATATAVVSASGAVFSARTISHSFMTLAGLKKCMPSTSCGRLVTFGDFVDVEIGGVGGQHRAGLGELVERA